MQPARIAELLVPFLTTRHSDERSEEESAVLSPAQLQSISTYIDILLRWNARMNLTAIRDQEQIVTRHFGESFFAARQLFPERKPVGTAAQACPERSRRGCPAEQSSAATVSSVASSVGDLHDSGEPRGRAALQGCVEADKQKGASAPAVADLGSGAGFPGIPVKLWAPEISLTLIESNHKKATFLGEVARALTLTDINIQTVRAETLTTKFDVVTLRAVERFADILPVAANLLAPAGRLALLIGAAQLDQAVSTLPTLQWREPVPIPLSSSRVLALASRLG